MGASFLVLLAATACKSREVVCEPRAFFRVAEPGRGAGEAPFSIDRLGSEVKGSVLREMPLFLVFVEGNRARLEWMYADLVINYPEAIYSPEEGLARSAGAPGQVFPLKKLVDGSSERVHLGFRSRICAGVDEGPCLTYGPEEQYLVADMTCTRR